MFYCLLAALALSPFWLPGLIKLLRKDWKTPVQEEPDPLKELEAAHRMELTEWDEQFHRLTDKWVDPPRDTRYEENVYFRAGLHADVSAAIAQHALDRSAMAERSLSMMAQQSQLNLQQAAMLQAQGQQHLTNIRIDNNCTGIRILGNCFYDILNGRNL